MAARGYDDDSVAGSVGTRRSRVVRRVERKPRGFVEETPEEIEDDDDDSVITDAKSEDSDIIVEEDLPEGPLYDLWKDIENLYPVPEEYFDPKLIEKNDQLLAKKKEEREEEMMKGRRTQMGDLGDKHSTSNVGWCWPLEVGEWAGVQ